MQDSRYSLLRIGVASKRFSKPFVSYTWDFGDGSTSVTATSPITAQSYTTRDEYTVTLEVTDGAGQTGQTQR